MNDTGKTFLGTMVLLMGVLVYIVILLGLLRAFAWLVQGFIG